MAVLDRLVLRLAVYELLTRAGDAGAGRSSTRRSSWRAPSAARGGRRSSTAMLDAVQEEAGPRIAPAVEPVPDRGSLTTLGDGRPEPVTGSTERCQTISSEQRRANFDELVQARRRSVSARLRAHAHGPRARDAVRREDGRRARGRADRRPRRPGASSRSAASARRTSSSLRRPARIQVYIRQDALPERDFQIFKLLDFGDCVGVDGHLFRTKTNELTIWASRLAVPGEVPPAAAREVARPERRRDPLPPALPRSDRQPGLAPGVRDRAAASSRRSASS